MEIHFEVENRCLLMCKHCSSDALINGTSMEYSFENIVSFLTGIPEHKDIFFTGGEPLLNDHLEALLMHLKENVKDISLGLFTSGIIEKNGNICSVSEEYAKCLAACGLEVCYVSVYSHDEKKHDWMTGKEKSFETTKNTIQNLKKAGVEIRINCAVTKFNKEKIVDLEKAAYNWGGTEIRLLRLVKHGRAINNWEEIEITEKEYRQTVWDALKNIHRIRITASGLIDILPCRPLGNWEKCQAGTNLLYITYHGEVFPCASVKNNLNYKIGKLSDNVLWQNYFRTKQEGRDLALCGKCQVSDPLQNMDNWEEKE